MSSPPHRLSARLLAGILRAAVALAAFPPAAQTGEGGGSSLRVTGLRPSGPPQPAVLQPSGPLGGSGFDAAYDPSARFWRERELRREAEAPAEDLPAASSSFRQAAKAAPEAGREPEETVSADPGLPASEAGLGALLKMFLRPQAGLFPGTSDNPAPGNLLRGGSVLHGGTTAADRLLSGLEPFRGDRPAADPASTPWMREKAADFSAEKAAEQESAEDHRPRDSADWRPR